MLKVSRESEITIEFNSIMMNHFAHFPSDSHGFQMNKVESVTVCFGVYS